MAKAAQTQPAKTVAKLFADIQPPVTVDELSEILVFKALKVAGAKNAKGPQVNFSKKEFVEANDGDVFEIDFEKTSKLDLQKVLAPKPGLYQVQGYDLQGLIIERAATFVMVENESGETDEDDDDDDDDTDTGDPEEPGSGDAAAMQVMARMFERMLARSEKASSKKEDPAVIIDTLREELRGLLNRHDADMRELRTSHTDELRSVRTKYEDQIRSIESKHENETQSIWIETKKAVQAVTDRADEERKDYNAERREWVAERRSLTDNYESQLRSLREQKDGEIQRQALAFEGRVQALQAQINNLQTEKTQELLTVEKKLLTEDYHKQIALREAADAQNVAATIREQAEARERQVEQQMKSLATAQAGPLAGLASILAPVAKDMFDDWRRSKSNGGPQLPAPNIQALLATVANDPELLQQLRDPAVASQIQSLLGLPQVQTGPVNGGWTAPTPAPTPTPAPAPQHPAWTAPQPSPQPPAPQPAAPQPMEPWDPGPPAPVPVVPQPSAETVSVSAQPAVPAATAAPAVVVGAPIPAEAPPSPAPALVVSEDGSTTVTPPAAPAPAVEPAPASEPTPIASGQ